MSITNYVMCPYYKCKCWRRVFHDALFTQSGPWVQMHPLQADPWQVRWGMPLTEGVSATLTSFFVVFWKIIF